MDTGFSFEDIRGEVDGLRDRVARARQAVADCFVQKDEIAELMAVCTVAQEPLLLVGPPGTAKSDLVVKFCEAMGVSGADYFEYMLTKFTEPSEIVGPIDLSELKAGRYVRRVQGRIPEARVVFLDEIFKSNSAILNTLLTIINERKYYQDGAPTPVAMVMLFAATNDVPEFGELAALVDRFPLKVESVSVADEAFDALISAGLRNESRRIQHQRPWAGTTSLDDVLKLKAYLDHLFRQPEDRARYFPDDVYRLFKRIVRTLVKEDGITVSDRKAVKLYRLVRTRAFLHHGGVVRREDLAILRHVADRRRDMAAVRDKVDTLLRLE